MDADTSNFYRLRPICGIVVGNIITRVPGAREQAEDVRSLAELELWELIRRGFTVPRDEGKYVYTAIRRRVLNSWRRKQRPTTTIHEGVPDTKAHNGVSEVCEHIRNTIQHRPTAELLCALAEGQNKYDYGRANGIDRMTINAMLRSVRKNTTFLEGLV